MSYQQLFLVLLDCAELSLQQHDRHITYVSDRQKHCMFVHNA